MFQERRGRATNRARSPALKPESEKESERARWPVLLPRPRQPKERERGVVESERAADLGVER